MFHLYIIYSAKYGKYYVGQTQDLTKRLESHNFLSENSYTSKFRPWELMISLQFDQRSKAMRAEMYLKKKARTFLQRLIDERRLQEYVLGRFG